MILKKGIFTLVILPFYVVYGGVALTVTLLLNPTLLLNLTLLLTLNVAIFYFWLQYDWHSLTHLLYIRG